MTIFCAGILLFTLASCGSGGNGNATSSGSAPADSAEVKTTEYRYENGAVTLTIPEELKDKVTESDTELSIDCGDAAVYVRPLSYSALESETRNLESLIPRMQNFAYYVDASREETTYGDYAAVIYKWNVDADWNAGEQGLTMMDPDPSWYEVITYGDALVGAWSGLELEVAVPEGSTTDINTVVAEENVKTILNGIQFDEAVSSSTVGYPGLSVDIPAAWNPKVYNDTSISAVIRSGCSATLYIQPGTPADPETACGYASDTEGPEEITYGDYTWWSGLRNASSDERESYILSFFTKYNDNFAMQVKVMTSGMDADSVWALRNDTYITDMMNSIALDPDSFHDPNDARFDEAGFEWNYNEIAGYTGDGGDVTIPYMINENTVDGVNWGVFSGNTSITSVTVEEGVTYIKGEAFRDCTNLTSVTLPDTMAWIGSSAFEGCTSLKNITFGSTLISIDTEAFEGCTSLGDVILPDSMTFIGSSAFYQAGTGRTFDCPASGVTYGSNALYNVRFDAVHIGSDADLSDTQIMNAAYVYNLTIDAGCTALGESFFNGYNATDENGDYDTTPVTVTLPDTIETIGQNAFAYRKGLTEINIGGAVTLGTRAFEETGLTSIIVPGGVKEIPERCFTDCSDLGEIILQEGVETVGENAFYGAGNTNKGAEYYNYLSDAEAGEHKDVVHLPGEGYAKFVVIELPSTLQSIGDQAFSNMVIDYISVPWLTTPDQLPQMETDSFGSSGTMFFVLVSEETYNNEAARTALENALKAALGDQVNWDGLVQYNTGKHHYWTDEELNLDY